MSAETTSLRDIANSVNFKDFNAMFNKAWKEFDDANRSIMEIVEAAIKDFEQHITAFGILQVNKKYIPKILINRGVFDIFSIIDRKTFLDAKAALAAPPRNCDVGTTEEQTARYNKFCYDNKTAERSCGDCPAYSAYAITKKDCHLSWAQMPYEKGGAK